MNSGYYHTKASVQEYIKLAQDVDGNALIEKFKMQLPSNAYVLELGSGPGTDWEILSKDFEVIGSDNSKEFRDHLNTTFPTGKFIDLDAITLNTTEMFDGIYSNKVLHHLNDTELTASISRQAKILNPKGIICHSFWNGEGSEVFKGLFVNLHSSDELNERFKEYFEILVLEEYAEFEKDDSLLLIGRKKL